MLSVYHFILDHRVGGPHVYVDTLRKALEREVKSIIVTTGRGPMTDITLPNLRHFWTPLYILEIIVNVLLLIGLVLSGRIERRGVIFNVHGSANLAPILAARVVGIPVVWHFHETTLRFSRLVAIGKWLLDGHSHALVVVANKAKAVYGLENAEFIPAAVDTAFWSRDMVSEEESVSCDWTASLDKCEQPFKMLAVGNLNPLKGLDILLDALSEIDGPWHLKVVGAELATHREFAECLYKQADEIMLLKKGCFIEFLGWREKTQVRALLASSDIFVLPSRSEACPIALLEAMAMGCRCVAADVGDVNIIMKNYSDGRSFPVGAVGDLCHIIEKMQIDIRMSMSRKLKNWTGNTHQLETISANALLVYNRLITKA